MSGEPETRNPECEPAPLWSAIVEGLEGELIEYLRTRHPRGGDNPIEGFARLVAAVGELGAALDKCHTTGWTRGENAAGTACFDVMVEAVLVYLRIRDVRLADLFPGERPWRPR